MLTEKEKQFLRYWEQVREKESSFTHKLLSGLPMALLFGLPILLFIIAVKLFLPGWYDKATDTSGKIVLPEWSAKFIQASAGDYVMAFVAVVLLVLFYSYFRRHFKWEMNEQLYKELKYKENKAISAAKTA